MIYREHLPCTLHHTSQRITKNLFKWPLEVASFVYYQFAYLHYSALVYSKEGYTW